jgi:2-succinyl-6-hydroxy-2,4-cyclohexadiene-1-carboxylate synthase
MSAGSSSPALVLLHGFTGSPRSFAALLARLPPGLSVHCPTLLGHGPEPTAGGSDFAAQLDALSTWLDQRGLAEGGPPVHLFGYSLGARVALGLLARHPARFARATLVGVHPGLERAEDRQERLRADQRWISLLVDQGIEAFVRAWEDQELFASQARLPPALLAEQRAIRLGHSAAGLARALSALGLGGMPDFTPALGAIASPVHLVVGGDDARFVALAAALLPRLRQGRLTVVPGAGHNVLLEQPEALAAALAAGPHPQEERRA